VTGYTAAMNGLIRPLAAALLAAAGATAAIAQAPPAEPELPPQYEVEVLVFANRDFDPSEERFDYAPNGFDGHVTDSLREPPVFDDTNLQRGNPPAPQVEPLAPEDPFAAQRAEALRTRLLAPEELKLGNEYRRLQAVSAYVPLVHAGWVQPGLPEADAEPFDLGALGVLNPRGTIRVHLGRFLHITLDLTYETDGASSPAVTVGDGLDEVSLSPRYRLTATRSARSGELHYFDHPAFGVLVRITPVPEQNNQGTRRPAA
jgi:hypothetical protein